VRKDIVSFIPQRPPMVMISEIETVDETGIVTTFTIDDENIFCSEGLFREPGLIENIAQSAAARVGYICDRENRKIPLGFIGAIKNLIIHEIPVAGDELYTKVTIEHEVMNATIISGKILCRGKLLAECKMNIFLQEEANNSQGASRRS
jgi:predicted hotdog family 3-hydroxylacyl-ACP dehydratase